MNHISKIELLNLYTVLINHKVYKLPKQTQNKSLSKIEKSFFCFIPLFTYSYFEYAYIKDVMLYA